MKDFYFLLDGDIVTDAIDYPAEGYTPVQLDQTHLPAGINAGYYRWNGTAYEIDPIRKAESDKLAAGEVGELRAENATLREQVAQTNADAVAFQEFIFASFPELS